MSSSTTTTPDREPSDAALADRAAAGDEMAFEALDRRHRSRLLRQCTHILRNGHDAEEAVQSALLKAYRALSSGRTPRSVLPWLLATARNECFDMIRARRHTEQLPADVVSGAIQPDELVVCREEARALRADIEELPEAQRAALVMRTMGDLPHAEIGRRLGGTSADARTLCHEARVSLLEFEEGRALDCTEVLERIVAGDGRALRARRIRAHLRACEGCQTAAEGARSPRRRLPTLGALFPFPSLAALRVLLAGSAPTAAIGGAVAIVATALVVTVSVHTGDPGHAPAVPPQSAGAAAARPAPASTETASIGARTSRRSPAVVAPARAPGASASSPPPAEPATPAAAPAAGGGLPSVVGPLTSVVPGVVIPPVTVPVPVLPAPTTVAGAAAAIGSVVADAVPVATPEVPAVPPLTP